MASGTITNLSTLKWSDASDSQVCVEVRDGIIAVFFEASNVPQCATFSCSSAGVLAKLDEETLTGITACTVVYSAIKITDGIAAFTYTNSSAGEVATVAISAAGAITAAVLDTLEFDDNTAESTIIHAIGDFWVIAFTEEGGDTPYIVTVDIDSSGTIAAAVTASQQLSATGGCLGQSAVKIATGIVAMFYTATDGGDTKYYVETRTISAAGAISAVIDGPDEWGGIDGAYDLFAFAVSGTIYACSYREGASNDGWVNTFDITATGTITTVDIDTFEYETVRGRYFTGAAGGGMACLFYAEYSTNDALFKTVDIDTSGNIGAAILATEIVDAGEALWTYIIKTASNLYIVVWRDADAYGQAACLSVESGIGASRAISVIDTRFHYVGEDGLEYYMQGTLVT